MFECCSDYDLQQLIDNNQNVLCVTIDKRIKGKDNLISFISHAVSSPYINDNWDGLYDALLDLSWLPKINIFLIHKDFPDISYTDLRIYLSLLKAIDKNWQATILMEGYDSIGCIGLSIYFPLWTRSIIETLSQVIS